MFHLLIPDNERTYRVSLDAGRDHLQLRECPPHPICVYHGQVSFTGYHQGDNAIHATNLATQDTAGFCLERTSLCRLQLYLFYSFYSYIKTNAFLKLSFYSYLCDLCHIPASSWTLIPREELLSENGWGSHEGHWNHDTISKTETKNISIHLQLTQVIFLTLP